MSVVLFNENKAALWYIIHNFLLNRIPFTPPKNLTDNTKMNYQFMQVSSVTKIQNMKQSCCSQATDLTD
jgi:hypothetical protein